MNTIIYYDIKERTISASIHKLGMPKPYFNSYQYNKKRWQT